MRSMNLGKFSITHEFIEDAPEVVQFVLGQVIVLEASSKYAHSKIEYTAQSDKFDEIDPRDPIPTYMPIVTGIPSEFIVKWEKRS